MSRAGPAVAELARRLADEVFARGSERPPGDRYECFIKFNICDLADAAAPGVSWE